MSKTKYDICFLMVSFRFILRRNYVMRHLVLNFRDFWVRKIVFPNSKIVWVIESRYCNNRPARRLYIECVFTPCREKLHIYRYDSNLGAMEVNVATLSHANSYRFYVRTVIIFILLFSFYFTESENVTNYTCTGDTTD